MGKGASSGSREPNPQAVSALSGFDPARMARRIRADDPYLVDYLLGWAGLADPQPWGAAHSFALEVGKGYGLIKGECDSTPTERGRLVAEHLAGEAAQ